MLFFSEYLYAEFEDCFDPNTLHLISLSRATHRKFQHKHTWERPSDPKDMAFKWTFEVGKEQPLLGKIQPLTKGRIKNDRGSAGIYNL